jgi:hypothetical protein
MTPSFVVRDVPAWVINGITVTLGLALVQCSIGLVAGAQAALIAIAPECPSRKLLEIHQCKCAD